MGVPAAANSRLPAGYPNRFCSGGFQARGELWGVEGRNISCRWQRAWAIRFLRQGKEPKHWRCVDLGDSGRCHRRHTYAHARHKWFEFYAQD